MIIMVIIITIITTFVDLQLIIKFNGGGTFTFPNTFVDLFQLYVKSKLWWDFYIP